MKRMVLELEPLKKLIGNKNTVGPLRTASSIIHGYFFCVACEYNKYVLYFRRREKKMLFIHESDRLESFNKHYEAALNIFYSIAPEDVWASSMEILCTNILKIMYEEYNCHEILNRTEWDSLKNRIINMETVVNR